ncbi:MAG: hypothetical protein ACRELB_00390, partial [Polyangiaceae bacterium]
MLRPPLARALAIMVAASALVLGATSTAQGQAASSGVVWDAPPADCPDQAYVRRAVDQLLSGDGPPPAVHVDARARVTHPGSQWQVHLTTVREGTTGERIVQSSSCRSLADATALIVALTIDPQRVAANHLPAAPTPTPTP